MQTELIRVLRVIARLNVGGPALHVCLLTGRLDPGRFESLLAAGTPAPDEGDMLALRPELQDAVAGRLRMIAGLGRDPKPSADLRALAALYRLIGEFRPHILHTHTAKAGTLGRIAGIARAVPVRVHTFHGTVFGGHFRPGIGAAIAAWERVLATRTHAVLAVSDAVAADLRARRIGGRSGHKVRVIPLGLDLSRFAGVAPLSYDSGVRSPLVAFIGRLAPVKDVPLFLDAFAIARKARPELTAIVAGDGPLRNEVESRPPPDGVEMLGHLADLPSLLERVSAVVLTSKSEGSPVALIEALAAGRPVVAVPVGGVPDVLAGRPGAWITSDREPETIARTLLAALEEPGAAEGGRQQVVADFGIDRLVADMSSLYAELLR